MTSVVLCEPQVISTAAIPASLDELRAMFTACNIKSPEEERESFLLAVSKDMAEPREFAYEARFPRDFGYIEEDSLPTLGQCIKAAQSQGLGLGSPAVAFALLCRQEPVVLPGKACLISMNPIVSESGYLNLPQIQTIRNESVHPQVMLRMVAGSPDLRINLNMSILFFDGRT